MTAVNDRFEFAGELGLQPVESNDRLTDWLDANQPLLDACFRPVEGEALMNIVHGDHVWVSRRLGEGRFFPSFEQVVSVHRYEDQIEIELPEGPPVTINPRRPGFILYVYDEATLVDLLLELAAYQEQKRY